MKIFIKNKLFFILTAIITLLTVTCVDTTPDNGIDSVSVYFGDTLNISGEQVWVPNYNTGKISQMYLKFEDNRDVDVIVMKYADSPQNYAFQKVGSGKVEEGKLSFSVNKLDESYLLNSDDLLMHYFNEWSGDGNITVNLSNVKGNLITLVTKYDDDTSMPSEGIINEGFYGTLASLTGEYVYYIYVNVDCTISAGKKENTELKYTFNKFNLSLKAGWNTICKSETYTTTGDSSYSITVDNPEIRWLMQDIKY
ncbi:hypothetical protein R84B8_03053 [Treponema sp. R8-4-B8]